jgi:hypothetical protein
MKQKYYNIYQSSPTCSHCAEQAEHQCFALAYMKTYISPKYGSEWRQRIDPYLQLKICRSTNLRQRQHGIYTQQNMKTDKQEART